MASIAYLHVTFAFIFGLIDALAPAHASMWSTVLFVVLLSHRAALQQHRTRAIVKYRPSMAFERSR